MFPNFSSFNNVKATMLDRSVKMELHVYLLFLSLFRVALGMMNSSDCGDIY